jgi:hypothetical protein
MAAKTREQKASARRKRWSLAFDLVERGEARELVRQCVELVDREGLGIVDIAERLNVAQSTVGQALTDPLYEKAAKRKAKGQRACLGCGKPCNTDGSRSEPSLRCAACALAKVKAEAKWQPEAIIAAIQKWAELYGAPPKAHYWNAGSNYTHPDYYSDEWPAWSPTDSESSMLRLRPPG